MIWVEVIECSTTILSIYFFFNATNQNEGPYSWNYILHRTDFRMVKKHWTYQSSLQFEASKAMACTLILPWQNELLKCALTCSRHLCRNFCCFVTIEPNKLIYLHIQLFSRQQFCLFSNILLTFESVTIKWICLYIYIYIFIRIKPEHYTRLILTAYI